MDREQCQCVEAVEQIVCQRMAGQAAGHDFDHVLRVRHAAQSLQAEVGGDRFVIELAALLHDIGDAKFQGGIERSGEFTQQILAEQPVASPVIPRVVEIVETISFRKRTDRSTLTLEAQIVQDADRLDALGAVGIVRTIEYGATVGQPFHCSQTESEPRPTGIDHFHEKLFRLTDLMNTDPARRIARQRHAFMQSFLDQYLREWNAARNAQ
ncbi:putative hydrolase [Rosistilla carotiformis]|uniref:Putative hydrolase n=1 Tax=Rosistilla carotiformis TaxID=2528017 RepID=A0A518JUY1_9BACT|nr:HD domain-containing protein [Rosistilla carotiformis]QDV69352.1 putative hydrolase [Rosistilla carotiformis]